MMIFGGRWFDNKGYYTCPAQKEKQSLAATKASQTNTIALPIEKMLYIYLPTLNTKMMRSNLNNRNTLRCCTSMYLLWTPKRSLLIWTIDTLSPKKPVHLM
jgi:hypothetical protein